MPAFLARENENKVPVAALWLTNIVIQAFLIVCWFAEYAFTLALKMTSAMTLIPYLLVAAFGLKLAWIGETYAGDGRSRNVDWARSAIATIYAVAMIYAGGLKFVLLAALLYAPGTSLYFLARREQNARVFTSAETVVFGAILVAAIAALWALVSGAITV
jgi:arginine:ornithine antiporter/lysine permease